LPNPSTFLASPQRSLLSRCILPSLNYFSLQLSSVSSTLSVWSCPALPCPALSCSGYLQDFLLGRRHQQQPAAIQKASNTQLPIFQAALVRRSIANYTRPGSITGLFVSCFLPCPAIPTLSARPRSPSYLTPSDLAFYHNFSSPSYSTPPRSSSLVFSPPNQRQSQLSPRCATNSWNSTRPAAASTTNTPSTAVWPTAAPATTSSSDTSTSGMPAVSTRATALNTHRNTHTPIRVTTAATRARATDEVCCLRFAVASHGLSCDWPSSSSTTGLHTFTR
jgi:hypothetical protein